MVNVAIAAVSVNNLRKTYGRGDNRIVAVNDVSFSVQRGEIVGLLGPNGAGKTSLIKCILNLVNADSGDVHIVGHNTRTHQNRMYRHVTGVLEGARNTYWRMSARENLAFFAGLQGIPARSRRAFHDELIEIFDLTEKADTPVNELSLGMKQKVAVACAFARETDVMFLDEPTLGLDLHASFTLRESLKQLAKDERRTIILSSHDMDVVQDLCERVIILNKGTIVADDLVSNLVALFRTEAYRVDVADTVEDAVQERIAQVCTLSEWSSADNKTSFTANVPDGGDVYALIDELRAAELPLAGIVQIEPDLSEVFLNVTDAETARRATAAQSIANSTQLKEVAR